MIKLTPITTENTWIFSYNIKYFDVHGALMAEPRIRRGTDDHLSRGKLHTGD